MVDIVALAPYPQAVDQPHPEDSPSARPFRHPATSLCPTEGPFWNNVTATDVVAADADAGAYTLSRWRGLDGQFVRTFLGGWTLRDYVRTWCDPATGYFLKFTPFLPSGSRSPLLRSTRSTRVSVFVVDRALTSNTRSP